MSKECGRTKRTIWGCVKELSVVQHLRREVQTQVVHPAITSRRDLTAKVVSLVGSDSILGSCFQTLTPHRLILHPSHTLDFGKPVKTLQIIRRGNPDCYIIGYSVLDTSTSLLEIARVVIEAAKYNGAQIVGFTDYNIYSESELQKTENSPIEQTAANPQVLYERLLNRYKNPLIFRIGKLFENQGDFVSRYFYALQDSPELQITNIEYSLTSVSLLKRSLALAIAWKYIETYNLCECGVANDVEVVSLLMEYLKISKKVRVLEQEEVNHCLDNSLWQAFSMTDICDWTTTLSSYLPKIRK